MHCCKESRDHLLALFRIDLHLHQADMIFLGIAFALQERNLPGLRLFGCAQTCLVDVESDPIYSFILPGFALDDCVVCRCGVGVLVFLQHQRGGQFNPVELALIIGAAARFRFAGIGGKFDAINGKHLASDQALAVTYEQDWANSLATVSPMPETKAASVVKCGWLSPDTAIKSTFSRQAAAICGCG